jgi:hypothetical protein
VASLKPLKSLAHNIPHHFASTLFYWKTDYAINHVEKVASDNGIEIVEIDLLEFKFTPSLFNSGITGELLAPLKKFVREQIIKHDFESTPLSQFKIRYDFSVSRIRIYDLPTYDCVCSIQTVSGRKYDVLLTEENN